MSQLNNGTGRYAPSWAEVDALKAQVKELEEEKLKRRRQMIDAELCPECFSELYAIHEGDICSMCGITFEEGE